MLCSSIDIRRFGLYKLLPVKVVIRTKKETNTSNFILILLSLSLFQNE